MAELIRDARYNLDLSAEIDILVYTYIGDEPIEVIGRIMLGDVVNGLSGVGGVYIAKVKLNGAPLLPDTTTSVPAGESIAYLTTRPIPLVTGDVITFSVIGGGTDSNVNTVAVLRNATPLRAEELHGNGAVIVDHNYGGEDNLQVVDSVSGASLNGTNIAAYLQSDYLAGRRTADFIRGQTTTDVNGRWRDPVRLDPETYVFVFAKPIGYSTEAVTIAVA